jgi:hypothetical protein
MLVAVRVDDGRYAGAVGVDAGTSQIGGWLAPHARGHGLGAELFGAAALLGHAHLGLRTVRAGHEPMNMASARALTKAGFVADDGPPRHTLPNGREIEARRLRHTATGPISRCRGAGPAVPGTHSQGSPAEGRQEATRFRPSVRSTRRATEPTPRAACCSAHPRTWSSTPASRWWPRRSAACPPPRRPAGRAGDPRARPGPLIDW